MPFLSRSARSLLALLLIASLVVAASPIAALGRQPAAAAADAGSATGPRPSPDARDAAAPAATLALGTIDDGTFDLRGIHAFDRPIVEAAASTAVDAQATRAMRVAWVTRATREVVQPKPQAVSRSTSTSGGGGASSSSTSYRGRNHLWIPALDVNRSVSFFSCSSSAYPGNRVYRWGCAGSNNVYLFGHASSVFKTLHDAYVRGRLSKGMKAIYADANGRVSTYAVSWWKITTPDRGAWAYAGQSRASLTLQTCVGANSQYRLIVRLLKIG